MANFDLSNLALRGVCPGNEILLDDAGMPSIMVKIPKMTYKQLGMGESTAIHPAFIINGQEVDAIYISKYQNIVQNSRAYSLPGVSPRASINFDEAKTACEAKGEGWHLMTRMEWGLLVRWCQANGVMPKGNNYYGKHRTESVYRAIPCAWDDQGRIIRTLTGTGPLTWYHDQEPGGIADLAGNISEWCGGIRLVYGEIQVLANNNGADSAKSQSETSTEWKAIKASDGSLITPNGSGTTTGSIKMDWQNSKLVYSTTKTGIAGEDSSTLNCTFGDITCTSAVSDAAKLLLQNLGLLMYGTDPELFSGHVIYANNVYKELCVGSGGTYITATSGLATPGLADRTMKTNTRGFRAAYVQLPTA